MLGRRRDPALPAARSRTRPRGPRPRADRRVGARGDERAVDRRARRAPGRGRRRSRARASARAGGAALGASGALARERDLGRRAIRRQRRQALDLTALLVDRHQGRLSAQPARRSAAAPPPGRRARRGRCPRAGTGSRRRSRPLATSRRRSSVARRLHPDDQHLPGEPARLEAISSGQAGGSRGVSAAGGRDGRSISGGGSSASSAPMHRAGAERRRARPRRRRAAGGAPAWAARPRAPGRSAGDARAAEVADDQRHERDQVDLADQRLA